MDLLSRISICSLKRKYVSRIISQGKVGGVGLALWVFVRTCLRS